MCPLREQPSENMSLVKRGAADALIDNPPNDCGVNAVYLVRFSFDMVWLNSHS